jgi:hypothetical protein
MDVIRVAALHVRIVPEALETDSRGCTTRPLTNSAVMADPTPPPAASGEEFEAGKIVFETLKPLSRERQERVLRWVAETLGITNPVSTKPSAAPHSVPPPVIEPTPRIRQTPAADIRSFIAEKHPRSDIQFVTAIAHFYRFEAPEDQRRDAIDADFAQAATRLADWDRLANPLSTLNNAVTKGYLDRSARGEFRINTVGENLVARTLPGDGEAAPARRKPPMPKAAKKKKSGKKR